MRWVAVLAMADGIAEGLALGTSAPAAAVLGAWTCLGVVAGAGLLLFVQRARKARGRDGE